MAVAMMATIQRWTGLSTDTKPTTAPTGSTFFEYDSKDTYITYDQGTNWTKLSNGFPGINASVSKDMPYLVEFWETESLLPAVWETTIDGAGTEAFGTAAGYMYYDMDTDAVANNDVFLNSKYRFQVRPATFGDGNTMLQRFILEFELQAVTAVASHDNTHFFLGLSSAKTNDITQQNIMGFFLNADVLTGKTDAGGVESTTGAIAATITSWNKYKIIVDDTSVIFSFNGVEETAIVANIPSIASYLVLGTRAEAGAAVGLNIGNIRSYYEEVL